ncbi:hemolysin family protein [Stenomitos frigidus]|uniref:HlyC/CorC family transporter n=1 Tax=Stenomitos frigidus ULC18 TaxID=2107698 RepID=A0A2T1ED75_9CYAN|nr:hemolysin family protein [Stenomitos frigidus]PSB30680.1 HlyC/CorC family transporter [Stenomitos frigidus ULC18]
MNTATNIPLLIGINVALIAINAFFAASEIALVSASDVRLQLLADQGNRRARLVLATTQDSTRFLATIQLVITLTGFLNGAFAAENLATPLAEVLHPFIAPALAEKISLVGVTAVIALVSLIFGELVPKKLAIRHAEEFSLFCIRPLRLLQKLTAPIVKLISVSTNLILELTGNSAIEEEGSVSTEEIKAMIDAGLAGGAVGEQERRIIHGAVELSNITARAIMVPRVQIQYLKSTTSLQEACQIVSENAHTRLPVCEDDLDNIVGILHVKDLIRPLPPMLEQPPGIRELLRPVHYIPETKSATDLLAEMKQNRLHLVIVRDEFGGTAGLVTLEDVLEEIVGEIRDEYDAEEEREFRQISAHEGIFKIRASIATVNNELDVQLPRDEAATLAGLFLEELQRPPEAGDTLQIDDVQLTVLDDSQRVSVILVQMPAPEEVD